MKMGSVAVAMAIMVMVMRLSVLQGAAAQGTVTCLSKAGSGAPFSDATAVVQFMREQSPTLQACTPDNYNCAFSKWSPYGLNVLTMNCGVAKYCVSYEAWGNYLNQILAQCNDQSNEVQGVYELTLGQKFYLTAASCDPNCT